MTKKCIVKDNIHALGKNNIDVSCELLFVVVDIMTPAFNVTSYIELSLAMNPESTYIQLTFNPSSPYGYLFYSGNYSDQVDFLSLSLVGGKLELRYDLGPGPATPLLSDLLQLNVWHTVLVTRQRRTVRMSVDGKQYGPVVSSGNFIQLNVQSRVNIGGLVDYNILSPLANRNILGLSGCIRSLVVSNKYY